MVKRKGNLISSLCNISNILIADSNARKAKKRSKRFIEKHDQNIIDEDMAIAVSFYNLSYKTSPYVTYKIYEPKERLIYRLPYYPDRIAHHAIMNIVKDYWTKQFISNTYSCIEGRGKHSGEKFDISKAKEICERYRGILPTSISANDVYVAINSQYHDYAELFKSWFGDGIEQRIIESAIIFWFKDADCKAEKQVVEYLREY